ncbi:MAG: hypothetical protein K6G50_12340 [bacterium]|nr:hypothetical protein [bacterium]
MRRPRGKCLTVFLVIIALTLLAGAAVFIGLSKKKTALAHFQGRTDDNYSSIKVGFIKSAGALPVYSMLRLNSGTRMNVELVAFQDYESMWEMMCSGNIEYCLAAAEEYALAVPRLKPGSIICALAEDSTNAIALADPAPESITRIVYERGLTGQAAAIKFCNSQQIAAKLIPVCEKDIPGIMERHEADAAVCDPLTADKLKNVSKISGQYPVTIVLIGNSVSVSETKAEFLLSKWFTIAKRLKINANSAIKAIAEDAEMPQAKVSACLENLHALTQEEALEKTQVLRPAVISAINDWAFAGAFREPVKQKKYSEDNLVNLSFLKSYCKKMQEETGSKSVSAGKTYSDLPDSGNEDPVNAKDETAGYPAASEVLASSPKPAEPESDAKRKKIKKLKENVEKQKDDFPTAGTSEVSEDEMNTLHNDSEQGYDYEKVVQYDDGGHFETTEETPEPDNNSGTEIKSPNFGTPPPEETQE